MAIIFQLFSLIFISIVHLKRLKNEAEIVSACRVADDEENS